MSEPNFIDLYDDSLDRFINKLDMNQLFNFNIDINELLMPIPKDIKKIPRPMNSFLCCRRKIYLLAIKRGLTDEIADGKFLTQVTTKIWKHASQLQKNIFVEIAKHIKLIEKERYENCNVKKVTKEVANVFVNVNMENFGHKDRIHKTNKKKVSSRVKKTPTNSIKKSISQFDQNLTNSISSPLINGTADFSLYDADNIAMNFPINTGFIQNGFGCIYLPFILGNSLFDHTMSLGEQPHCEVPNELLETNRMFYNI
ncbi:10402_t:CDS:1 [Dentiscutata erythropus]|uniref:10402_t:CDS:1 n=1 Tax=Dentiscutata erythropus TaxID=1348616 RepID=A0A9N8VHH3_9GLOM|nr:10402_t:CDS:1 [Dentiscutata erythropus]